MFGRVSTRLSQYHNFAGNDATTRWSHMIGLHTLDNMYNSTVAVPKMNPPVTRSYTANLVLFQSICTTFHDKQALL